MEGGGVGRNFYRILKWSTKLEKWTFFHFFILAGTSNEKKLKKVKCGKKKRTEKTFNCINVNKLFYHFFIKMSENPAFSCFWEKCLD